MQTDRQYAAKRPGLALHIVAFHTRGLVNWQTICGRPAVDPVLDVLPTTGHVCAHCERIFIRQVDPS